LPEYGEQKVFQDVDGIELLAEDENEEEANEQLDGDSDEKAEAVFLEGEEFDNIFLKLPNDSDENDDEEKAGESKKESEKEHGKEADNKPSEELQKGESKEVQESQEKDKNEIDAKEISAANQEKSEKKEPELSVTATRILTEEDFEKIKRIRRRKALGENAVTKTKKKNDIVKMDPRY